MGQSGRRMMVRHEIGARHLAGKVAPLSRLSVGEKLTLRTFTGCQLMPLKGLLLLVVLIGNKHGQVGNENGAGTIKPFMPIELRHGGSGIKRPRCRRHHGT